MLHVYLCKSQQIPRTRALTQSNGFIDQTDPTESCYSDYLDTSQIHLQWYRDLQAFNSKFSWMVLRTPHFSQWNPNVVSVDSPSCLVQDVSSQLFHEWIRMEIMKIPGDLVKCQVFLDRNPHNFFLTACLGASPKSSSQRFAAPARYKPKKKYHQATKIVV